MASLPGVTLASRDKGPSTSSPRLCLLCMWPVDKRRLHNSRLIKWVTGSEIHSPSPVALLCWPGQVRPGAHCWCPSALPGGEKVKAHTEGSKRSKWQNSWKWDELVVRRYFWVSGLGAFSAVKNMKCVNPHDCQGLRQTHNWSLLWNRETWSHVMWKLASLTCFSGVFLCVYADQLCHFQLTFSDSLQTSWTSPYKLLTVTFSCPFSSFLSKSNCLYCNQMYGCH